MPYIETKGRNQMMMCSLDSFVDQESIARVIDAFEKAEAAIEGRPGYDTCKTLTSGI